MADWHNNDPITNRKWAKVMLAMILGTAEMADDIVVQREGVERTREWQHGPLPKDRACDGMTKPIYVPPEKLPDPCRRCGHDEWFSNGIVLRGKDTKNVVYREKK